MSRIPGHTIDDAPEASRPFLKEMISFSPTGQPLNLHAQMAHSPAVLDAYSSLRGAAAAHGTLEHRLRAALMLAAAVPSSSEYAITITSRLALTAGWGEDQVRSIRTGQPIGDDKVDALVAMLREAAQGCGRVSDASWTRASCAGWTDQQLAESFLYLGLALFTSYFLNYAETDNDLPVRIPAG